MWTGALRSRRCCLRTTAIGRRGGRREIDSSEDVRGGRCDGPWGLTDVYENVSIGPMQRFERTRGWRLIRSAVMRGSLARVGTANRQGRPGPDTKPNSGLRSHGRARRAAAMLGVLVALLTMAATASADYAVDRFIGEGQFSRAAGAAVNEATGQVYVLDRTAHRVLRLDSDGDVEAAWGRGVRTGGTAAEVCLAKIHQCRDGLRGVGEGMFANPAYLALHPASGNLYVFDGSNFRVQEFAFDDAGTPGDPSDDVPSFVRAWGWGVQDGGNEFQVCVSSCQEGLMGSGVGQFNGNGRPSGNGIAVSPVDGDVFVVDAGADVRRIQRFNDDGSPDAGGAIESPSRFGSLAPQAVAIDSAGVLYAADTQNNGEIERYDTAGAHGPQGFLDPISSPPLLLASDPLAALTSTGGLSVEFDPDAGVDRLYVYRTPSDGSGVGASAIQVFDEVYTMYFGQMDSGAASSAALFYVVYLFRQAFEFLNMGYASAMAWLLFVVILIITVIQLRVSKSWVYYEGR